MINKEIFAKYTSPATFAQIVEYDTVSEMWENCVSKYASLTAVVEGGKEYTFSQLEKKASALRGAIKQNVNKDNDRIAILATNSIDFVKAYLAVVTSGNTAIILPATLDEKAVMGCCLKLGADAIIYEEALEDKVKLVDTSVCKLSVNDNGREEGIAKVDGKEPAVIMFTGGTTGGSKAVLLSNEAVMQGTINGCYGYENVFNQRYLLVIPLTHVFGLIRNLMTSLYTGSMLYICKNNKDMFKDIAVFRPTILVLVPALAELALQLSTKFKRNMLGDSVKTIIAGAAAVSPYLVREYQALGIKLLPGYGLTESANLVSGNPESLSKPDSVGILYPNQEYKVVDGELWLKGKNIMDGYIGEEESFTDGWFRTGDLVKFDVQGYMYIVGRIKEVIVLPSGENISPQELEAKFNELDFVQDCQVYEDKDRKLALEIYPRATELKDFGEEDIEAEMLKKLQEKNLELQPFQRVNDIIIRDSDFERTPSMKIVRYQNDNK